MITDIFSTNFLYVLLENFASISSFSFHHNAIKLVWLLSPFNQGRELPGWHSGKKKKKSACQHRRQGFGPWVRRIPWRKKWKPTPVFFPGETHGQRRLAGYSPRGCKESDMTEWLSTHEPGKRWKMNSAAGIMQGEDWNRTPGAEKAEEHCVSSVSRSPLLSLLTAWCLRFRRGLKPLAKMWMLETRAPGVVRARRWAGQEGGRDAIRM